MICYHHSQWKASPPLLLPRYEIWGRELVQDGSSARLELVGSWELVHIGAQLVLVAGALAWLSKASVPEGITSARSTRLGADYSYEDSGSCVSGEQEGGIFCAPPLLPLLLHSAHHKDSMYIMTLGNWNGQPGLAVRFTSHWAHCVHGVRTKYRCQYLFD